MATTPEAINRGAGGGLLAGHDRWDWLWAALVAAASGGGLITYGGAIDAWGIAIVVALIPALTLFGWSFPPLRLFLPAVAAGALAGIGLYGGDLAHGEERFLLVYLLSGQSATMWMSALFVLATLAYYAGLFASVPALARSGTALTWWGAGMGLIGLLVRWRETYLVDPAIGYFPISNLYEAFVLFCLVTALLWLYYEWRYAARNVGGFVMTVITAAVAFLLWYSFERAGHEIEPLVPALDSYWMRLHVPANFVGYGSFALAAMIAVGYLLRARLERTRPGSALATRLPALDVLDDMTYKIIMLGFAFFTIATFLGAVWAAEAWGSYWNWDPKEAWALIVWLNYAGWLHMRLTKGWRGTPMAWWALIGLVVTAFCFVGVNMFLSGLHSYGEL